MVLSLWEPLGLKKQWTRVGIVNHAYWPQPEHSQNPNDHGFRKTNIRSFTWCDSFKASASTDPFALPAHENRWGASLLMVVNDLNEISIIQVRRSNPIDGSSKSYGLHILATHTLENQETSNNLVCSGSLFERALKERQRTTSLSCGPWLSSPRETSDDFDCAVAVVAAVCGTQLRLVKLEATFENSTQNKIQQCTLSVTLKKHPLELSNEGWASHQITGPLGWLHTVCLVSHANTSMLLWLTESHRRHSQLSLWQWASWQGSSPLPCPALLTLQAMLISMPFESVNGQFMSPRMKTTPIAKKST